MTFRASFLLAASFIAVLPGVTLAQGEGCPFCDPLVLAVRANAVPSDVAPVGKVALCYLRPMWVLVTRAEASAGDVNPAPRVSAVNYLRSRWALHDVHAVAMLPDVAAHSVADKTRRGGNTKPSSTR